MSRLLNDKVELVPLTDIQIGERQRSEYDPAAISKLADSIAKVGLNVPILLDENNRLIAGGCRIKAHEQLGRTHIQAVRKEGLEEWELVAIELFENIHRTDLSYDDEVRAKAKFHKLYQQQMGQRKTLGGAPAQRSNWRLADTADLIGTSISRLSADIELADALSKDESLSKFKHKSQAYSELKRRQETLVRTVLAATVAKPSSEPQPHSLTCHTEGLVTLYNSPCDAVVGELADSSIAALITDPPWQVDYDATFGTATDIGLELTENFLKLIKPKLTVNFQGWLFCATKHLIKGTIYNLIHDLGYHVSDQIYIWYKPQVAHSSRPYAELKNDYEPAVWFSTHPQRRISSPTYAINAAAVKKKLHPAQKPVKVISQLIELSTVPGELVIDPFCGSGVVGYCCQKLNRRAVVVDKNPTHYNTAVALIGGKLSLEDKNERLKD